MGKDSSSFRDAHEHLRHIAAHLEHVLPAQAPIQDFVHHNTLHAFEHLKFPDAITAARELTGARGYLDEEQFRIFFREGRITREDLVRVLRSDSEIEADAEILRVQDRTIRNEDVFLCGLIHTIKPLTRCQLNWHVEENAALERFQQDTPRDARQQLVADSVEQSEAAVIEQLWTACLASLGLVHDNLHPEELMDLSPSQVEAMMANLETAGENNREEEQQIHWRMEREADLVLHSLLRRVGDDLTLRGFLKLITGEDVLEPVAPLLIRQLANHLDQGVAAWHSPEQEQGFYASWRSAALLDHGWMLDSMPDWQDAIQSLPESAIDTVFIELRLMGLPEERWDGYLQRLVLELPGWSGMFHWRSQHPDYHQLRAGVRMMDYLAVRLVLERLYAQQVCRRLWNVPPHLDLLGWHLRRHKAEFMVRYALFNLRLPEYAVSRAQRLLARAGESYAPGTEEWQWLSRVIWTWRHSPAADRPRGHSVYGDGWRLFRLAQHLGLGTNTMQHLLPEQAHRLLACLNRLTPDTTGFLWLRAYENHYRDELFSAVAANHGYGRWPVRDQRPQAQLVFCMDDREEGIRRHLEEHNPDIETLGAAGFFGVAMNWKGLDDDTTASLCPVVVSPSHEIQELAQKGAENIHAKHNERRALRLSLVNFLFSRNRHTVLAGVVGTVLAAPIALLLLIGKTLFPLLSGRLSSGLRRHFEPAVATGLRLTAPDDGSIASAEQNRPGFTDNEQTDRVEAFLRTIGLTSGFAPLVVMVGHGSSSLNNPHRAAYDCGACSGRHGGPNARVFAAMANRPGIRRALQTRGIEIPDDTWFLGAFHNTCDESIDWFDVDAMPASFHPALEQLRSDLDVACHGSAHERCRKFANAPVHPDMQQAFRHVMARHYDFSQARPELGHATNAAAFIGRRSLSRGAFFDRRVFLISYDPTHDVEGKILEAILLAAGPVSAGISLEYYFSTVNNRQYGCGSKVTHNITGFFGVMEGIESDLRTGLPKQMTEIHEAMRLQVLIEAKTDVLTAIYRRQPPIRELVGNGWLLLSAKDPDSAAIHVFDPDQGWLPWTDGRKRLPTVTHSREWYNGHMEPLLPVLIRPSREDRHA